MATHTEKFMRHQVEIQDAATENTICAGTIISSYLILTLFSCLAGKNQTAFKIRAKGSSRNDQIRTIDQVHSYPAQQSESSSFDVAVLLLNSKLELDDTHTSKLPYEPSQPADPKKLACRASVCLSEIEISQVKTIGASGCSDILEGQEEKNVVCTEPALKGKKSENCTLPLPGSGLVCSQDGASDFLCGVLAMTSSNDEQNKIHGSEKRVYRNVSAYSNWIQLVSQQSEQEDVGAGALLHATSVGGDVVDQKTNPVAYQLSLQKDGNHHCGAVILDRKTALTAAHCFDSKTKIALSRFTLVAGEQNLHTNDGTEQVLHIQKLAKHPKYNNNVLGGNDIAVLQIQGEFNFTDRVNNVWISSPVTPNYPGLSGTATGWGKTTNDGRPSNVLQAVELQFMDRQKCRGIWTFLKPSILCGHNDTANVCSGDSGGPFVIKNYYENGQDTQNDLLVGITSFAPIKCELSDEPNGFANVTHFYEWIAEKRSNSLCSSSQFQCFNGECIDEELKCDKNYDCEDGSDEKICQSYTRVTHHCGGLIKLANSHEIQWRAPTSSPHPNSSCLWIIANPHADRTTNTEIKIVKDPKYQFDSASSQLYAVRNLTGNQLETSLLNDGAVYNFSAPFLMLHFRTSSTSANNGILLRITDKSESSDYIAKHVQGLDLNQNTNQSFSHVYSGSHCRSKVKSRTIFKNAPTQNSSDSQNPPYTVSIRWEGLHVCTGIILDKKTALSTASCFDWRDINETRIVAGETNLSRTDSTEQILEIEKIVKHENWIYPRITQGNDIALIHIKGEFNFSKHVNNIWISSPETLNLEGVSGSVAGWIATNSQDADFLPDIKRMDMDLLKHSDCKRRYPFLKESMMCAFKNGTNVCGMTGAPFVLNQEFGQLSRDVLIGISTFGPSACENIRRPVAFTRVDYFYDWIERNRGNSSCSSSQFQCYNGQCISSELKCNYVLDCSDGSDENVCQSAGATTIKTLDSCARRPGNETAVENEVAAEEENLFLFLKPVENGGRIQVDIDSLQMATAQDSLNIFSYRQNAQEITRLNSVRGAGNWTDKIYDGDENESILMYFHAHNSNENQKMNLDYFERPRV